MEIKISKKIINQLTKRCITVTMLTAIILSGTATQSLAASKTHKFTMRSKTVESNDTFTLKVINHTFVQAGTSFYTDNNNKLYAKYNEYSLTDDGMDSDRIGLIKVTSDDELAVQQMKIDYDKLTKQLKVPREDISVSLCGSNLNQMYVQYPHKNKSGKDDFSCAIIDSDFNVGKKIDNIISKMKIYDECSKPQKAAYKHRYGGNPKFLYDVKVSGDKFMCKVSDYCNESNSEHFSKQVFSFKTGKRISAKEINEYPYFFGYSGIKKYQDNGKDNSKDNIVWQTDKRLSYESLLMFLNNQSKGKNPEMEYEWECDYNYENYTYCEYGNTLYFMNPLGVFSIDTSVNNSRAKLIVPGKLIPGIAKSNYELMKDMYVRGNTIIIVFSWNEDDCPLDKIVLIKLNHCHHVLEYLPEL